MSALKDFSKRHPHFATIVSTVICVAIGWERAKSYAQTQPSTPAKGLGPKARQMIPLEARTAQKFDKVKTKDQACALLEGKLVTYYDSIAIVSGCIQRPVEDSELLNELVLKKRTEVSEIPAHVYRLIPFGEAWVGQKAKSVTTNSVCNNLESDYVTSTGTDYYYVENCKKRSFSNYVELQAHNKKNAPVVTLAPDKLDKIPDGKPIEGSYNREVNALYNIVGDSTLNTLNTGKNGFKPVSSAEDLESLPRKSAHPAGIKTICRDLNRKVVSYYSQIFFVTDCQKRLIKDLPVTVQQRFEQAGITIIDVSSQHLDTIPTGRELSEEEVLTILK